MDPVAEVDALVSEAINITISHLRRIGKKPETWTAHMAWMLFIGVGLKHEYTDVERYWLYEKFTKKWRARFNA